LDQIEIAVPGIAESLIWLDAPLIDIAARDIRQRVREGRSIRYLVVDAVRDYVTQQHLYRCRVDQTMDSEIKSRLVSAVTALVVAAVIAGCGTNDSTPTAASTPTPPPIATPTRLPVQAGNNVSTTIPPAVSRSALLDIRERSELRVGVLYNYPPFSYLTADGQVAGYEIELIRRIATAWEVEATFAQVTRQTRLPMLASGEVDFIAGAVPHRRDLEALVEFSDTTFRSGFVVLALSDAGLESIAQVGSGPVGVIGVEGESAFAAFAGQRNMSPSILVFSDVSGATAALRQGAVRAVVGRREALMLASISVENSVILNEFVAVEPYAFAVRGGDTPLRDLINLTLQQVTADSSFIELFNDSFYGYGADLFPMLPGEPAYTFQTFPADITEAPPALDRIRRGEVIRVGGLALNSDVPRFDGQAVIDGFNRAVANEMARRWNVPVVEVPNSAGGAGIALAQSGEVDLVMGLRPDLSLFGNLALSQPYYTRGIRLIHLTDVPLFGIGDLEFKDAIAAPPVDVSEDLIRDNNSAPRIEVVDSYEDGFTALTSRAVYGLVGDEFSLFLMAQADPRLSLDEHRYRPVGYAIGTSAGDVDFQALINFSCKIWQQMGHYRG
jgi:ABC-type amino acid transport substrate-binding protein